MSTLKIDTLEGLTSGKSETVDALIEDRLISQTANDVAGTAALLDTGTAAGELPTNADLGSASLVDTGTAAGEVPLNSSLVPKSGGTFTGDIEAPKITASTGILFGTDTAAANTLDGYEEGSWTPVIDTAFGSFPATITGANGTYTKIGNLVYCRFEIDISSSDAVALNDRASFSGLPFFVTPLGTFDGLGTAFQYESLGSGINGFWSVLVDNSGRVYVYNTSLDGGLSYSSRIAGSFTYTTP